MHEEEALILDRPRPRVRSDGSFTRRKSSVPEGQASGVVGLQDVIKLQRLAGNGAVAALITNQTQHSTPFVSVQRCGPVPPEECGCHEAEPDGQEAAHVSPVPSVQTQLEASGNASEPIEGEDAVSQDCGQYVGSCEFYRCRQRNTGTKALPGTYYLSYGLKYCERFSRETRPLLSPAGQRWLDQTLTCLQEHIHKNVPFDADPGTVRQSAFDSHPDCYVRSGLCFLTPSDWLVIWQTIDLADNDLKQTLVTSVYCAGNMLPMAFPVHSLAVGGGYAGLMERDRRRAYGGSSGVRPFPPPQTSP